jgi:hypothetical protein
MMNLFISIKLLLYADAIYSADEWRPSLCSHGICRGRLDKLARDDAMKNYRR